MAGSVTGLGDFWKFLVTWFLTKEAQMHVEFWAKVKGNTFYVYLLWLLFGQLLENLGHFLI